MPFTENGKMPVDWHAVQLIFILLYFLFYLLMVGLVVPALYPSISRHEQKKQHSSVQQEEVGRDKVNFSSENFRGEDEVSSEASAFQREDG